MSNKLGWAVAVAILAGLGFYGYSCVKVNERDSSFHQNLDQLRRAFQNHDARSTLITPSLVVDEVLELAAQAGVVVDQDAVVVTAEPVEIAVDDTEGCVVREWPDSARNLSELDQGKLGLGISQSCHAIPHWVIGVHAEAHISRGWVSRDLVYEGYFVIVRYSEDDEQ